GQAQVVLEVVAGLVAEHQRVGQVPRLVPRYEGHRYRKRPQLRLEPVGVELPAVRGGRVRRVPGEGERRGDAGEEAQRRLPYPVEVHIVRTGTGELRRLITGPGQLVRHHQRLA